MAGCFEAGVAVSRDDAAAGVQSVFEFQRQGETGRRWFPVHRRPAAPEPAAAEQRYRTEPRSGLVWLRTEPGVASTGQRTERYFPPEVVPEVDKRLKFSPPSSSFLHSSVSSDSEYSYLNNFRIICMFVYDNSMKLVNCDSDIYV